MSTHTEEILKQARYNEKLAIEIYCELYIYNNYSKEEVGVDCKSYGYPEEIIPDGGKGNSWKENLRYRLNSIFRRRGISFRIEAEEVDEIISHSGDFVPRFI